MKYFIFHNNLLQETDETTYKIWVELNAASLLFEGYWHPTEEAIHYLETMYVGALDKDEWDNPLPFILFYDMEILEITENGVKVSTFENKIYYFAIYEELKEGLEKLIQGIEAGKFTRDYTD